jgi:hypothetical protein
MVAEDALAVASVEHAEAVVEETQSEVDAAEAEVHVPRAVPTWRKPSARPVMRSNGSTQPRRNRV